MKYTFIRAGLLALNIFFLLPIQAQTVQYQFHDLGTLGGPDSFANGINDLGQVVGYSRVNHTNFSTAATLWNNGSKIGLPSLDGYHSAAYSINNAGQIVGYSEVLPRFGDPLNHATLWSAGGITDLGTADSNYQQSYAYGINNAGQAVGQSDDLHTASLAATMWNGRTPINLTPGPNYSYANAINTSGLVVGTNTFRPTLWNHGGAFDLGTLGGDSGSATSINDLGVVVGVSQNENYTNRATMWQGEHIIDLGSLGGSFSHAMAINNQGWVVGSAATSLDEQHATLWLNGQAIDLNQYLSADDVNAGWVLDSANAINAHGLVVGNAYNARLNETHAYMLSPIPEPESYAMLLLGLAGLGWGVARRKRHAGRHFIA